MAAQQPRRTKIVATIGPATNSPARLEQLVRAGLNVARLNFSHGTHDEHTAYIANLRSVAQARGVRIPIIQDLSGPREVRSDGHGFDTTKLEITEKDLQDLDFGIAQGVDYIAQSYVGVPDDVLAMRAEIEKRGAHTPIIAKIERAEAVAQLEERECVWQRIACEPQQLEEHMRLDAHARSLGRQSLGEHDIHREQADHETREQDAEVRDDPARMAEATTPAEVGGDHFRSSAVMYTHAHPKLTEGSDVDEDILAIAGVEIGFRLNPLGLEQERFASHLEVADREGTIHADLTNRSTNAVRSMQFVEPPAEMQISPEGHWSLGHDRIAIGITTDEHESIVRVEAADLRIEYWQQRSPAIAMLTIELEQNLGRLERELDFAIKDNNAKRAMGIVMDPNTGAVLALATYPLVRRERHFISAPQFQQSGLQSHPFTQLRNLLQTILKRPRCAR